MKQLPEKLLTLRKTNGLSQEDLAEKLNVTRQAVSRWENGTAAPDAYNLLQISKLFQVSADFLLNDDYVPPQSTPVPDPEPAPKGKNPAPFCLILAVLAFFTHHFPNPFTGTGVFAALFGAVPLSCVILGFALADRKHGFPKAIRRQFYLPAALLASFFVLTILIHLLILIVPDLQTQCFFLSLRLIRLYDFLSILILLFGSYTHFRETRQKSPS